jgi:flagellar biosynthetic protein FlhB
MEELLVGTGSVLLTFDLQLFAAEDEGRTEQPTDYKKRKAREDGKVAKTPELPAALIMLFGFFILYLLSRFMLRNSLNMMSYYLGSVQQVVEADNNLFFLFKPILPLLLRFVGPVLGVAFVGALAGNIAQVGLLFTTKPIQPDFSRINPNPARFIQKILLSRQAAVNLGKSIFKIAAIGAIAFLLVRNELRTIAHTIDMDLMQAFVFVLVLSFRLVIIVSGLLLVLALPDYLFARSQHIDALKMTRQEVKEERKMLEGDPLLKSRMRERQRAFARRRMLGEVPTADVVITNPIHFAVALRYETFRMSAPLCVAKGQDLVATRIKQIAEENEVVVYENKPLARELYRRVEVGDEIPDDLFTAVAEVLAFVYRLKREKEPVAAGS